MKWSKVNGQWSKVNGQRSILNCPLGTCDAFTKATGRLKELSIKNYALKYESNVEI